MMVSVCAFGEGGWGGVILYHFKMSYYGASKRVFEHTSTHTNSKILKQKRVFEEDDSDGVDDGAYGHGDDNEDIMLMMH